MAVIGADDRRLVSVDLDTYPFSAATFVVARFPDGTVATGSGALIGPNDVLTAAHVIHARAHGGYADEVTVIPAAGLRPDGSVSQPFGRFTVDTGDLAVTNAWQEQTPATSQTPWAFDYGLIDLGDSVGRETGWFAIDPLENPEGRFVESLGYPGDIQRPQMVYTAGTIDSVGPGVARFFDDLDLAGGQSGSAVVHEPVPAVYEIMGLVSNETFFPESNGIVRFDARQKLVIDQFAEGNGDGRQSDAAKGPQASFLEPYVEDGWYYERNPDVARAGAEADLHFDEHGRFEGRDPNPWFDTDWYVAINPDVAEAGVNPLLHYARDGWREGRAPSPAFDGNAYQEANPDVAAAGIDPLRHYLDYGQFEGRTAIPVDDGFGA